MRCACIDIGSNTTALLVADVNGTSVAPIGVRRAFTMIGASLRDDLISPEKMLEVQDAVTTFVQQAREMNADSIRIVATHGVREAVNGGLLARMVEGRAGLPVQILTGDEEARHSFAGASGGAPPTGRVTCVIDAGGGSTEITWSEPGGELRTSSFEIGSSSVLEAFLTSDPPLESEIDAARARARAIFSDFAVPADCRGALVVGGGATTAREIVGGLIDSAAVDRVLAVVTSVSSTTLAERFKIEWQRARLLPAGLIVLAAVSDRIGLPLEVGRGGLREGVVIAMALEAGSPEGLPL
ncbi:MAG: hypothetical protein WAO61_00060 [Solirubrobacterales bacterium]